MAQADADTLARETLQQHLTNHTGSLDDASSQVLQETLQEGISSSIADDEVESDAVAAVTITETIAVSEAMAATEAIPVHAPVTISENEVMPTIVRCISASEGNLHVDSSDPTTVTIVTDSLPQENLNLVASVSEAVLPQISNVPSWAARLRDCEPLGDYYRGYVTNEVELDLILTLHKQQTNSCWGTRQSPSSAKPSIRLMWKSQYVPYDGIPFLNNGRRATVMECQYGPRRKGTPCKKTNEFEDTSPSMKKGHRPTCPARIYIKKVKKFPEYKIDPNLEGKNVRQAQERALTALRLAGVETGGEERFYVQLPLPVAHEYHDIEEIPPIPISPTIDSNRLDPRVATRIRDLVAAGINGIYQVKHALRHYIEKELFTGGSVPPRHNKSFFPTVVDIQNHVHQAQLALQAGTLMPMAPPPNLPPLPSPKEPRPRKRKAQDKNSLPCRTQIIISHFPDDDVKSSEKEQQLAEESLQHLQSQSQDEHGNADNMHAHQLQQHLQQQIQIQNEQMQQQLMQQVETDQLQLQKLQQHVQNQTDLQHLTQQGVHAQALQTNAATSQGDNSLQQSHTVFVTENGAGKSNDNPVAPVYIVVTSGTIFPNPSEVYSVASLGSFSTLSPAQISSLIPTSLMSTGASSAGPTIITQQPDGSLTAQQAASLLGSSDSVMQSSLGASILGMIAPGGVDNIQQHPVQANQLIASQAAVDAVITAATAYQPSTSPNSQQAENLQSPSAKRQLISAELAAQSQQLELTQDSGNAMTVISLPSEANTQNPVCTQDQSIVDVSREENRNVSCSTTTQTTGINLTTDVFQNDASRPTMSIIQDAASALESMAQSVPSQTTMQSMGTVIPSEQLQPSADLTGQSAMSVMINAAMVLEASQTSPASAAGGMATLHPDSSLTYSSDHRGAQFQDLASLTSSQDNQEAVTIVITQTDPMQGDTSAEPRADSVQGST